MYPLCARLAQGAPNCIPRRGTGFAAGLCQGLRWQLQT